VHQYLGLAAMEMSCLVLGPDALLGPFDGEAADPRSHPSQPGASIYQF
jgi:hypothetical protein